jgi:hypothetical protein
LGRYRYFRGAKGDIPHAGTVIINKPSRLSRASRWIDLIGNADESLDDFRYIFEFRFKA